MATESSRFLITFKSATDQRDQAYADTAEEAVKALVAMATGLGKLEGMDVFRIYDREMPASRP